MLSLFYLKFVAKLSDLIYILSRKFRTFFCVFQENQKDLENATEQLSEYLEREITSEMLADIKQRVQDKYR